MRNGDETVTPCAHCPDIRFFTGVQKCVQGVVSVVTRTSLTCRFRVFRPSIPRNPTVLFAIWRQKAHLRVSSRQNCIVVRSTHVSSKHDCAPQTRITWLEGRENHFMGVCAKIYSSCLELLLLHRLDDGCGSRNLFLCLRSWFPKFVQCFRLEGKDWVQQKIPKEIFKNVYERKGRRGEFVENKLYLFIIDR